MMERENIDLLIKRRLFLRYRFIEKFMKNLKLVDKLHFCIFTFIIAQLFNAKITAEFLFVCWKLQIINYAY